MSFKNLTGNKDIDLIILSNLDDKSLFNFSISNPKDEYLKKLCGDEFFWMNRLKNKFPEFKQEKSQMRSWKQTYLALVYSNKHLPNAMKKLAKYGMKNIDLIDFFIQKSVNDSNFDHKYLLNLDFEHKYLLNLGMEKAASGGHRDLVQFFIEKGADNWNDGMMSAAKGGDKDLVNFFIEKGADYYWNFGMLRAARGGHRDLVQFFIEKGADHWDWGMLSAAEGGHRDLVQFFIQKGANEWNFGMYRAARGGHRDLVEFFIEKDANDWNIGMIGAGRGGHKDLISSFKNKKCCNIVFLKLLILFLSFFIILIN